MRYEINSSRHSGAAFRVRLLIALIGLLGCCGVPRLAYATDQGQAYAGCKAEEVYFAQYERILASCFESAPRNYTYVWQGSGPPHTGYNYPFDSYCAGRTETSLLVTSAPPSVVCQAGCAYSAVGQGDSVDGPTVLYSPSGSVCPNPPSWSVGADPDKNQGVPCAGDCLFGDPINAGTGNKYESKTEYRGAGAFPLEFSWSYNSKSDHSVAMPLDSVMGSNRSHSYMRSLSVQGAGPAIAYISRPDGKLESYRQSGPNWVAEADNAASLRSFPDSFGNVQYQRKSEAGELETYRADGRLVTWALRSGLVQTLGYDSAGLLIRVTDPTGRVLGFRYNANSRLSQLDLPDGQAITFTYDTTNWLGANLVSVGYPGGTSIEYRYNEAGYVAAANPHALTGVLDENGVRFSSTTYDSFQRATSSYLAAGLDAHAAQYTPVADGSFSQTTVVTGPLAQSETRSYQSILGRPHLTTLVLGGPGVTTRTTTNSYDAQGRPDLSTDALGVVTDSDFDASGLLTQVIRAKGTAQQQTQTWAWDPILRVPTSTAQVGQNKSFTYNARGQALTVTVTDTAAVPNLSRTSTMTYCEQADVTAGTCPLVGLLVSVNGPRTDVSDVTSLSYYPTDDAACAMAPATCRYRQGDLWKMTNALGQVSETLSYDGAGRPLSAKDPNGIVTDLEYSTRGWLTASKVRGSDPNTEADDAITRIYYDLTGEVTKVTQPDGSFASFTFDAAHRLTDTYDALGNRMHYVLDNAGNRIQEDSKDSSGTLKRTLSRLYNSLNQLQTLADAAATPTDFAYDLNGYSDKTTDALGRITDSDVDPLGRLSKVIANTAGTSSDRATTQFGYDARDNLTTVIDPKGLTTTYGYNGFDDLIQLASPDTGIASYAYDSAGNRTSQLDARGKLTGFGYDALGRLTSQAVPTVAQNVYFDYDIPQADCASGETFGVGRLSRIRDESGSSRYCYDERGHRVRQVQTVIGGSTLTVGATFNSAGQVVAITYPSGAIVTYLRNPNGQINRIDAKPSAGAAQVTLVSSVSYLPFGPLNVLTFGNGRVLTKSYDQNYGIDKVSDGAASNPLSEDFTLDVVGNVIGLTERIGASAIATRTFSYDGLDRLTGQKNGASTVEAFAYEATGDRISKTVGASTTAYGYPASSHRISSISGTTRSYDNNGNTTLVGTANTGSAFTYDDRSRLREFKVKNKLKASYRYNGRGERVLKTDAVTAPNSRQFVYDETGHLIGEYSSAGVRVKEYVWLDDTLVAILSSFDASTYQYVETDHLGTPRTVVHPSKNVMIWRWDLNNTAFGDHAASVNPDGDSLTYLLNLRFPGQYLDIESGLNYNHFRDYDPVTGRYIESDPIGLGGGNSTYAYVGGSPITGSDPSGLLQAGDYSLPNWLVDGGIGLGSGVVKGLSFGLVDPRILGIDVGNANQCSGIFRGAEFVGTVDGAIAFGGFMGLAGKGLAARGTMSETALLQDHLSGAVARFEVEGFSRAQTAALASYPRLSAAFRGARVDGFFKESVALDARLSHLEITPMFRFGPDVFHSATNMWWDVTTSTQWSAHVAKYSSKFGQGTGLFY